MLIEQAREAVQPGWWDFARNPGIYDCPVEDSGEDIRIGLPDGRSGTVGQAVTEGEDDGILVYKVDGRLVGAAGEQAGQEQECEKKVWTDSGIEHFSSEKAAIQTEGEFPAYKMCSKTVVLRWFVRGLWFN